MAGTVAIFAFSVGLSNSSMYDPYWSVAPPALFAYWLTVGGPSTRAWIALGLVGIWGVRLTANFLRGWPDLEHEDWRYPELRKKHGRFYWAVSFFGIHFFPTLLTFAGSLALYVIAFPHMLVRLMAAKSERSLANVTRLYPWALLVL